MKTCWKCKETKELTKFYPNKTRKDKVQSQCKICQAVYFQEWLITNKQNHQKNTAKRKQKLVKENREKVIDYLKNNPCISCGESDIVVLEFDHRDRNTKEFDIGQGIWQKQWKYIEEEIKKCDILCCNCHRRRTTKQMGWFKSKVVV